jgi:hypothetical protein
MAMMLIARCDYRELGLGDVITRSTTKRSATQQITAASSIFSDAMENENTSCKERIRGVAVPTYQPGRRLGPEGLLRNDVDVDEVELLQRHVSLQHTLVRRISPASPSTIRVVGDQDSQCACTCADTTPFRVTRHLK